jgi:hypothetical protein
VQRVESPADLPGQPQDLVGRQAALAVEPLGEGLAVHVPDRQEGAPALLAGVQHRHQVPVLHLGRRPGLVDEPPPVHLVLGQLRAEHLQRHDEAVRLPYRPEDDARGAVPEARLDPVPPHPVTGPEVGTCYVPTSEHRR